MVDKARGNSLRSVPERSAGMEQCPEGGVPRGRQEYYGLLRRPVFVTAKSPVIIRPVRSGWSAVVVRSACALPGCGQPCPAACHPGQEACPLDRPCPQRISLLCKCGSQSVSAVCGRRGGGGDKASVCDEACAKETRKRQMAAAFGKQHQTWDDSQQLLKLAQEHPLLLLRRTEHQLTYLISSNAGVDLEADEVVPNVVFPAMGSAQRKLIHLLTESYGLHSESSGQDAARSVWVTPRRGAKVPPERLSHVLFDQQREAEAKGIRAAERGSLLSPMGPAIKTPHLQRHLGE